MSHDHSSGSGPDQADEDVQADEGQQHLAVDRTDLAEDRTVLANERTFAGWFRTGLGCVGIGIAFHALFVEMEPPWAPRAIATAFMLIGIYLFVSAEHRAGLVLHRLSVHRITPIRDHGLKVVAYTTSLAVAALIASVWLLPI